MGKRQKAKVRERIVDVIAKQTDYVMRYGSLNITIAFCLLPLAFVV